MENATQNEHQTDSAGQTASYPFSFTGSGAEYFKIWIVNVALTILTLGIYSAWAKVRTNRYFYANFMLDGEGFEYLAEPIQILKGRIVAVLLLAVYLALGALSTDVNLAGAALIFVLSPAIIVLSLRFKRRMTSYRNIRFGFSGGFGDAYKALFLWPILGILSLGILLPLAQVKAYRFVVNNSTFGTEPFRFSGRYGDYGKLILLYLGMMVGIILLLILFGAGIAAMVQTTSAEADPAATGELAGVLITAPVLILTYGVVFFMMARYFNLLYLRTTLRTHGFRPSLTGRGYAWIWLSNIFLSLVTLGLYFPFAKVRLMNYVANRIELVADGSLEDFSAAERSKVSALGQELGSTFDIDFGIGV